MRPIVVEGPDGGGKSTLVRYLARALGVEPFHTGGPKRDHDAFREQMRSITKAAATHTPALFDRIPYISEQIYAPLDGRLTPMPFQELNDELIALDPIVIYCRLSTSDEMLLHMSTEEKAHKPKDHVDTVRAKHGIIFDSYEEFFARGRPVGLKVIRYNWQTDDLVAKALKFLAVS